MNKAAALLHGEQDFECFSKVKTDVNHFLCKIHKAAWEEEEDMVIFSITANRFLRGMVRALTATMLQAGRGKIDSLGFRGIIEAKDCTLASFAVPPHGLFLIAVEYAG